MRIDAEAQRVRMAQAEVTVAVWKLQAEHDLTDVEMLQAIAGWQDTKLKHMLRAERHPDDPDRPADVADPADR